MKKEILHATITREDLIAREWLKILQTKFDTINERTKNHTKYIRELEKKIKKLESGK